MRALLYARRNHGQVPVEFADAMRLWSQVATVFFFSCLRPAIALFDPSGVQDKSPLHNLSVSSICRGAKDSFKGAPKLTSAQVHHRPHAE